MFTLLPNDKNVKRSVVLTWHSFGHLGNCWAHSLSRSFGNANKSRGSLSLAMGRKVLTSVLTSSWLVFRAVREERGENDRKSMFMSCLWILFQSISNSLFDRKLPRYPAENRTKKGRESVKKFNKLDAL